MKYFILPIWRILVVIFYYLILTPIVFLGHCGWFLWCLNYKTVKENFIDLLSPTPFLEQDTFGMENGDRYWVYKTPLDFLLFRKSYWYK